MSDDIITNSDEEATTLGVDIAVELLRVRGAVQTGYLATEMGAIVAMLMQKTYTMLHEQATPAEADRWITTVLEAAQAVLQRVRGIDCQFTFLRKGN